MKVNVSSKADFDLILLMGVVTDMAETMQKPDLSYIEIKTIVLEKNELIQKPNY